MPSAQEAVAWIQDHLIRCCQYAPLEELSQEYQDEISHNPRLVSIVRRCKLTPGDDVMYIVNNKEIKQIIEGILEQQRNRRKEASAVDTYYLQDRVGRFGDATDIKHHISQFIGRGLANTKRIRIRDRRVLP